MSDNLAFEQHISIAFPFLSSPSFYNELIIAKSRLFQNVLKATLFLYVIDVLSLPLHKAFIASFYIFAQMHREAFTRLYPLLE